MKKKINEVEEKKEENFIDKWVIPSIVFLFFGYGPLLLLFWMGAFIVVREIYYLFVGKPED